MQNDPIVQARGVNNTIEAMIPQMEGAYGELQTLSDTQAGLAKKVGLADATIVTQKGIAELAHQQANAMAAAAFGVNPQEQSFVVAKLAEEGKKAFDDAQAAKAEYDRKVTTSFFDNPLEWITNQFTINQDVAKFNTAMDRRDMVLEQSDKLNRSAQSQFVTNANLKQSVTAASIEAEADKARTLAELQANAYKAEGMKVGIAGMKDVLQLRQHELSNMFQVANLELARSNHQLALEAAARARTEFDWKKELREDELASYEKFKNAINAGAQKLGVNINVEGNFEARDAFRMIRSGKSPVDKIYEQLYMVGMQGLIGATPGQALDTLSKTGAKLTGGAKTTADFLADTFRSMPQLMPVPGESKEDRQLRAIKQFNETAKARLGDMAGTVKADSSNLYYPGSMKTIIEAAQNSPDMVRLINNSRAIKDVILPAIAIGQDLAEPEQVLALVRQALADKKINFNEAMDVSTLYKFGVAANNQAKGFVQFGMLPQDSYKAKISSPYTLGSDKVDVSKDTEFARYLMKIDTQKQTLDAMSGSTLVNPFAPVGKISRSSYEAMRNDPNLQK